MVRFYTVFLYSVVTVYMYLCTFCNRCTINGRYDDDDEGGLTIYPRVANFLQCTCAKNYKNWLTVDKVIAKIVRLTFLPPPPVDSLSTCWEDKVSQTQIIRAHRTDCFGIEWSPTSSMIAQHHNKIH